MRLLGLLCAYSHPNSLHPLIAMSFHARIHNLTSGEFLLSFQVEATDLHEAEKSAIFHAAQALTSNPQDLDVRHLHECAKRPDAHALGQLNWHSL